MILYSSAILVGAAGVALGLGLLLFLPVTDWLAVHDVGKAGKPNDAAALRATDAVRGRLLTFGAGVFAVWALWYTARNFWLSHDTHVTDRYTKAIDQLAPDKGRDVHIGGIYALERLARDSPRHYQRMVMEVLAAFVREHSREPQLLPADNNHSMMDVLIALIRKNSQEQGPSAGNKPAAEVPTCMTRPDVQAALTVIGRRKPKYDRELRVNLKGADLTSADLTAANLTRVDFTKADLTNADLTGANLTGANLTGANLTGAVLTGAVLTGAVLTRANLTDALWPAGEAFPTGWQPDARSGHLRRADTDPGGTANGVACRRDSDGAVPLART